MMAGVTVTKQKNKAAVDMQGVAHAAGFQARACVSASIFANVSHAGNTRTTLTGSLCRKAVAIQFAGSVLKTSWIWNSNVFANGCVSARNVKYLEKMKARGVLTVIVSHVGAFLVKWTRRVTVTTRANALNAEMTHKTTKHICFLRKILSPNMRRMKAASSPLVVCVMETSVPQLGAYGAANVAFAAMYGSRNYKPRTRENGSKRMCSD